MRLWTESQPAVVGWAGHPGGSWAAFLYALEGDPKHREIAEKWLLKGWGLQSAETIRKKKLLDTPANWQGPGNSVDWYLLDVEGYVPSYGGPYWFCSFDVSGPTQVKVSTMRPLEGLKVLPESRGVSAEVHGSNTVLYGARLGQIVLEPDRKNGPLILFANPPEATPPDKNDPNVRYFGPGLHRTDAIQLTNHQTLYFAPGAIVQGGIHARGTNITIRGRGILDGDAYRRFKGPTRYPVLLENCRDVTVEGTIIKDGWSWTSVPGGCDRVGIENVEILSARVENGTDSVVAPTSITGRPKQIQNAVRLTSTHP